jgi:serine/threonine protein kinase
VFFELLTGRRPFDADSGYAILKKQVNEQPPPPSQLEPGVPPELDQLVLSLLRKTPGERPASAEDLAVTLRDWLNRAA